MTYGSLLRFWFEGEAVGGVELCGGEWLGIKRNGIHLYGACLTEVYLLAFSIFYMDICYNVFL